MLGAALQHTPSYLLGALLFVAGIGKVIYRRDLRKVLSAFIIVPRRLIAPLSWGLPVTEMLVGSLLVSGWGRPYGSAAAGLIFALFAGALGVQLHMRPGSLSSCGCWGLRRKPPGWGVIGRNVALIGVAGLSSGVEPWRSAGGVLAAGAVVVLLCARRSTGHGDSRAPSVRAV